MTYRLLLVTDDSSLQRFFERRAQVQPDMQCEFRGPDSHGESDLNSLDVLILDLQGTKQRLKVPGRGWRLRVLAIADTSNQAAEALRAGADDCLIRPFAFEEMEARLAAVLRRVRRSGDAAARFRLGKSWINLRESSLERKGTRLALSDLECRLLRCFLDHRGRALSRATLLRDVWGCPHAPVTRTVDVHILRLRRKIEEDPARPRHLITVPGIGYRLDM